METRKERAVQRVIDFVSLGPHHVSNATGLVGCGTLLFVPVEVKEICIQMSTDKTIGDIILLKDPNE